MSEIWQFFLTLSALLLNKSFFVEIYSKCLTPFEPEFRKNSFNLVGKLQLFRSVKLIETHRIMKITKKFTLHNIK